MNPLKRTYYLAEVAKIKRGNYHGRFINAKPFFMLALVEAISSGVLKENKISFPQKALEEIYLDLSVGYEPSNNPTPMILPLLHLRGESFYNIKWKGSPFVSSPKAHSPSSKYLRDNFDYSYLDAELWDLLQDPFFRNEIKQVLIDSFIK